ncbi:alkyl sulfatase dimerization domain-containing protein [Parendozoicomonas haliclonae]|uniref:Hydroxyacylglutathione hydrolase n=1 Tax=Parendozoicomonas haliclonae TaxID=1960125 RepID=A0A1X7ARQ5_9GAMM|nr:alkyl sulfatase dimerization domain-containing protein [Parendozoicomonas haliclonae]SMA50833.1 Hydroxyacylglutathione hydrolase [Parendozoicomonas haliclonae]
MIIKRRAALLPLSLSAVLVLAGCGQNQTPETQANTRKEVHPLLKAHSYEFERKVYQVTDNVHVAVGFGLANSIMIEGDDGIIIVDVMESREAAEKVMAEFRKITDKPVKALIYTHNHADHILGGKGFAPDGEVDVYAHATTDAYINRIVNHLRPVITTRSSRMFGNILEPGDQGLVNAGIGPALDAGHGGGTPTLLRPTKTFDDTMNVEIAGVQLQLVHAPGETNDQLFVYLPEQKVLLPGDNIYKAFPNLYTIRGTANRDVMQWVGSLDLMRELAPEHLVPSHSRPISGQQQVAETLTMYRDGIQYVHDQTLRGMNQGLTEDQLVEAVKLPEPMVSHPYLQELYGTVEWSVRSIFNGYLGWFDGDAATLSKAPLQQRGENMLALVGKEKLLLSAREAIDNQQNRWALELISYMLFVEPDHQQAKAMKAEAMRNIGLATINPNGRNYYLTQAMELEGFVFPPEEITDEKLELLKSFPAGNFVQAMTVALNPEKSAGVDTSLNFNFTDRDQQFTLHVRNGIAEFVPGPNPQADIQIAVALDDWVDLVATGEGFARALANGTLEVEGGLTALPGLVSFLSMFDPMR